MKRRDYFYRTNGKPPGGPLSIEVLRAASTAGSLNSKAEVALKADGPWIPLEKLLEHGELAFALDADKGIASQLPTAGGKNPKGSMVGVGILVLIALVFIGAQLGGKVEPVAEPETKAASSAQKPSVEALETAAKSCVFWAGSAMGDYYDVQDAERELSEQRSAGEAQLKAIKLQEANSKKEKTKAHFEKSLEELSKMELAAQVSGKYSKPIKVYLRYGERAGDRVVQVLKYKGILHPEFRPKNDLFSAMRWNLDLDFVLSETYVNEAIQPKTEAY